MTVNVGVDLRKTQFTVYVSGAAGNEFGQYSTEETGYEQFLGRVRSWRDAGNVVRAGVESTGNTRYFKNRLEAAGVEVVVINILKFKIDRLEESVKEIEAELAALTEGDRAVELLQTIPGCGPISAWTIRAYTDDIKRFVSAKKYAACAGLVPEVPAGTRYKTRMRRCTTGRSRSGDRGNCGQLWYRWCLVCGDAIKRRWTGGLWNGMNR